MNSKNQKIDKKCKLLIESKPMTKQHVGDISQRLNYIFLLQILLD